MVIARHTVYSYIFQKKRFFLLFWAFDNKKKREERRPGNIHYCLPPNKRPTCPEKKKKYNSPGYTKFLR